MHVGIANPRWRGKRPRHSRRMRNPQCYVSGKRPMDQVFPEWSVTIYGKGRITEYCEVSQSKMKQSSPFDLKPRALSILHLSPQAGPIIDTLRGRTTRGSLRVVLSRWMSLMCSLSRYHMFLANHWGWVLYIFITCSCRINKEKLVNGIALLFIHFSVLIRLRCKWLANGHDTLITCSFCIV